MRKGETFVGILDSGAEEPKSKALRYVVSGVALAAMLAGALWYFLRFAPEKHTVVRFMDAVVAGDSPLGYKIWRPIPSFKYEDFLAFWGPKGYYSPIKSYRIESAEVPPRGGSGAPTPGCASPWARKRCSSATRNSRKRPNCDGCAKITTVQRLTARPSHAKIRRDNFISQERHGA